MSPHEINMASDLAKQLREEPMGAAFPEPGTDYYERFRRIDEYLNVKIHPTVNQGAAVNSAISPGQKPKWLTDHGPEHISTVIQRASALACHPKTVLFPYEVYLLLLSIHFHDVGNIFGREHHEKKITQVMNGIDPALIGMDKIEHRQIRDIALVHGGDMAGANGITKDTIGQLPYSGTKAPRLPLIAGILRLADELADDHTRTSRFMMAAMPPEAEVYHMYADRLKKVEILTAEHRVDLTFEINEAVANKLMNKDGTKVLLYDEILARTAKTHRENTYCSRFIRHAIYIDHIRVTVNICSEDYMDVRDIIIFPLRELGYPATSDIRDLCPDLTCKSGKELIDRIRTLKPKGDS